MAATFRTKDEGEEKGKSVVEGRKFICELSPNIQRLISSFLHAGDSIIFRRHISKSLTMNLIPSSAYSRMTNIEPHPLLQFPEFPYLLSLPEENVFKFHHPLLSGSYGMQIPELSEARISFSSHGWLLMYDDDDNVFFFEPFSKKKIVLPKCSRSRQCDDISSMCFNSPPTCRNCFVIALGLSGGSFYVTRPGEESWTKRSINNGQDMRPCPCVAPVVHNKLCYCLSMNGLLGVFNPEDKKPSWTIYDDSRYSEEQQDSLRHCFLLKKNNS